MHAAIAGGRPLGDRDLCRLAAGLTEKLASSHAAGGRLFESNLDYTIQEPVWFGLRRGVASSSAEAKPLEVSNGTHNFQHESGFTKAGVTPTQIKGKEIKFNESRPSSHLMNKQHHDREHRK